MNEPVPPFAPEEVLPWVEVAHSARVASWTLRAVGKPRTGSQFEILDAHYPPELASAWCRSYLEAAIEHLLVWADLCAPLQFRDGETYAATFRPVQTLSRAALEAAAQAVWVMEGGSAKGCARRHLGLVVHDLDEQRKAAIGCDAKSRVREESAALHRRLAAWAPGETVQSFPGYLNVVKAAVSVVAAKGVIEPELAEPHVTERLWRASAGSAHGKRWPSLELQIPHSMQAADSAEIRRFPDPEAISRILMLASSVLSYGVLRFADYSVDASALPEIMSSSIARLARSIPRFD